MKKPPIKLENYEQIYEYYKNYKPNYSLALLGHAAMGAAFRPRVEYASDAKETIPRLLKQGRQIILASNHRLGTDPVVVAAMAQREAPLRPMRGKTLIPSKEPIFNGSFLKRIFLRRGVDVMGAVPTFRSKDVKDPGLLPEKAETKTQTRRNAGTRLIETMIHRLDHGDHMAIFPEGKRYPKHLRDVQPLMPGIVLIACGVSHETELSIVPTAIYYGDDAKKRFTPQVFIGEPIHGPFDGPSEVLELTHAGMQESLERAAA